MRAVRLERFGEPLELREVALPEPRAGEALVRIAAAGVCGTDVKLWKGDIPETPLPLTLGHEAAGIVSDGPWTSGEVPAGTHVVVLHHFDCGRCRYCRSGRQSLCVALQGRMGFDCDGCWAEYVVVPVRNLFVVPDGIPSTVACVVPDAVATSWRAVVRVGGVRTGDSVVVVGLGGLGLAACQIAAASGAEVLGVDVSPEKVGYAVDAGIERVALADDAMEAARELQSGCADVVVDCAGTNAAIELSIGLLERGGRLVQVGYSRDATISIPAARLALAELQVRGCRAAGRADLVDALAAVARGAITPVIGRERRLEDAQAALVDLVAGTVVGRQVLVVDPAVA